MTAVTSWSVLVPLKPLDEAKSRLRDLPAQLRQDLVAAMACDVRDAILACPEVLEVVIVTRDPRWRRLLDGARTHFVADSPTDRLNSSLRLGAAACRTARPGCGVAALTADLPALTPRELSLALGHLQAAPTFFVPDAHGDGTTLFAARPDAQFWPHYGVGSRARHVEAGAKEITQSELMGIRQDVDTVEDLVSARALGLGLRTDAVVSAVIRTHVTACSAGR